MSKAKIYIITFIDLNNMGYTPAKVYVDTTEEDAKARVKDEYLKKCKEVGIKNPFDKGTINHQLGDNFAYIFDACYWDIFEKEIGLYCINE